MEAVTSGLWKVPWNMVYHSTYFPFYSDWDDRIEIEEPLGIILARRAQWLNQTAYLTRAWKVDDTGVQLYE